MDFTDEQAVQNEARRYLIEISLELEAAATAARRAAAALPGHRDVAWREIQQMYARYDQASRRMAELRATVEDAVSRLQPTAHLS